MEIKQIDDYDAAASFIYENNQIPEHRVGCLPREKEKIKALLESLHREDVLLLVDREEIIALIGVQEDGAQGLTIGPITTRTDKETIKNIQTLWSQLLESHPNIETFEFYIDEKHKFGQAVMKDLKTQYLGTEFTMCAEVLDAEIDTHQVVKYSKIYHNAWNTLMKSLYLDPKDKMHEILDSLEHQHELFLIITEGIAKGYLWLEVHDHDTCYVDYVAIHPDYRKLGLGHKLVAYASEHAFKKHHATKIQLVVEDKRKRTIEFYEKLGFKKIGEMHHFKYERQSGDER